MLLARALTFEDKLLLLFIWICKYQDYHTLGLLFGISPTVISGLIDTALPKLAEAFLVFIPNISLPSGMQMLCT